MAKLQLKLQRAESRELLGLNYEKGTLEKVSKLFVLPYRQINDY
jgi:hypothetical protein